MKKEDQPAYYSDDQKPKNQNAANDKASYGGNLAGWKDLMLKPQLAKALKNAGFQHPSEVQQECIPYAVQGHDILCQAKSGMGKTAVFALSVLNQLAPNQQAKQVNQKKQCACIVISHTRQLAYQIQKDFKRFGQFVDGLYCGAFFGGLSLKQNMQQIQTKHPQIIVGTPGRLIDLMNHKKLKLQNVKHFVIDQCDNVLGNPKMRVDVQSIFLKTPKQKQVMMFSATMNDQIKKGSFIIRLQAISTITNGNIH